MTADSLPTDVLPPADAEKVARANVQRGLRALAQIRAAVEALGAADKPELKALLDQVEAELDALRPPDPRKCKEYLRAISRERKGLIGIRPEDVVRYCRCPECTLLRMKMGLEHPSGPTADDPDETEGAADGDTEQETEGAAGADIERETEADTDTAAEHLIPPAIDPPDNRLEARPD